MALMWTSTDDVTSRWIGPDEVPATQAQISALLEDAEDTILGEFPTITVSPTLPQRRIQKVAARMVIRHLRNPGGIRSIQDGGGPYQQSLTYGGTEPGALYLTDDDRAELGQANQGKAFTIDSTPADTLVQGRWISGDIWEPLP